MRRFLNSIISSQGNKLIRLQNNSGNQSPKPTEQSFNRKSSNNLRGEICLPRIPLVKDQDAVVDEKVISKVLLMMKFVCKNKHPKETKSFTSNIVNLGESSPTPISFNTLMKRIAGGSKKKSNCSTFKRNNSEVNKYELKNLNFKPVLKTKKSCYLPPLKTKSTP